MSWFRRSLFRRRQKIIALLVITLLASVTMLPNLLPQEAADIDPLMLAQQGERPRERTVKSPQSSQAERPQEECGERHYMFNGKCLPCHKRCLTGCLGDGDDSCFACRGPKDGNRCVDHCPRSRPFVGGSSGRWCVARCAAGLAPDVAKQCKPKWQAKKSLKNKTVAHQQPTQARHEHEVRTNLHTTTCSMPDSQLLKCWTMVIGFEIRN